MASAEELHCVLRGALGFPGWQGCNWDAFWDAITGLIEMPRASADFRTEYVIPIAAGIDRQKSAKSGHY
ncbi:barstar family protein [Pseudomonas huanghezhanensis]|uniref:barstar family protein n=1 Tax=Pseudomonas huanghezhanensis TaxID=3002903 RepID=UPI002286240D|nr:barstar family protein [Pseudomonas sp. BSw22131]